MTDGAQSDENGATVDPRTRVEGMTTGGDFAYVADLLREHRAAILDRWLDASTAQPFHAGRRESAVADHIPALVDALIGVLRRAAAPSEDPGSSVNEPDVLGTAQQHARIRSEQGLTASDVVTEFRLLRQEIGWALRSHAAESAATRDLLGAAILLHDALDDAAFLATFAVDARDAEVTRLRDAILNEQLRLSALLEQLPAAVMLVEAASGQVSMGHPKVERFAHGAGVPVPAGETPNEWQGFRRDGQRYAPEDWPLARAVRDGEVVTGEEIDYLRDDGKRGTVSVNAAPIRDTAGVVVAGVAIFTDITDRKTLEQEKETYLTAIAHDLQNPLTIIKGAAALLQRDATRGALATDAVLDRGRLLEQAADSMVTQLAELRDIALLRTGERLDLQTKRLDALAVVTAAVARLRGSGVTADFAIVADDLPAGGLIGDWDEARLTRVLDNLLGNAVKFSPADSRITVTLTDEPTATDQSGPRTAVVTVRDEGIGIPADDLPHIFDWFRRASNVAGKIAGTGIGLAAARQIVELHGGSVSVESEEGNGATFALRLPLAVQQGSETERPSPT